MLTTRELATAIIVLLVAVALVAVPRVRRAMAPHLRNIVGAVKGKILAIYLGLVFWAALGIAIAWLFDLWELDLLKDSIIIVFTLGIPVMFRATQATTGARLVRVVFGEAAGISAFLAFYLNLQPLSLAGELFFQIVLGLMSILVTLLGLNAAWAKAAGISSLILLGALVLYIGLVTAGFIATWGDQDWDLVLRSLWLSLWLPAVLVPYFYVLGFYMYAETVFTRLNFRAERKMPRGVGLALVSGLRFSLKLAARLDGRYKSVSTSSDYPEARREMKAFRDDVKRRDREERHRVASLKTLSGVGGVDADLAQMDRREFFETKDRLSWISTTQMGRYEGNGHRYWDDLTDWMVDAEKHGLPEDHGFVTEVTADGQKWRAWRKLPGGWYLGIGGAKHRSEYYYQGSAPPATWPGDNNADWVSNLTYPLPSDWEKNDLPRI